jgi:Tetratricopeptide repeat
LNIMATHPEPGKPDRPEDQQNPVPPPEAESDDAGLAELMEEDQVFVEDEAPPPPPPPQRPSGSAVNLGASPHAPPPQGTPAGESSFPWEALLDEPVPPEGTTPPTRFDAPSDAGVLEQALADEPREGAEGEESEEVAELADDEDVFDQPPAPVDRESSRVDLAQMPTPEDLLASASNPPPGDLVDDGTFITEAGLENAEGEHSDVILLDSGVDLAAAGASSVELGSSPELPESGEDSSTIDLGNAPVEGAILLDSSSTVGLEGAVLIEDDLDEGPSAVDLGGNSDVLLIDSSSVLPSAGAEVLPFEDSQSDVFVGADIAPPPEGASGLGASGISLEDAMPPPNPTDSGSGQDLSSFADLADDEIGTAAFEPGEGPALDDTGSSVNLGEAIAPEGSDRDLIAEAVESGVDLADVAEEHSDSGSYAEVVISEEVSSPPPSSSGLLDAALLDEAEAPENVHLEMTREWTDDNLASQDASGEHEDSGHVELGGPPPPDSAEGTFEDHLGAVVSDEMGEEEMAAVMDGPVHAENEEGTDALVMDDEADLFADEDELATQEGQIPVEADGESAAEKETPAETKKAEKKKGRAKDKDEQETVPPASRPKYGRRWLAGTLVGMLLGGVTCVGLWLYGIEPPSEWRTALGMGDKKPAGPRGPTTKTPPPLDLGEMARNGNFSAPAPEGEEADPALLARRAEYRWMKYLHETKAAGGSPKLTDEEVKKALADLEKAGAASAQALYWQGYIHETLNDVAKARKLYETGAEKFKADKDQKNLFEAALDRLDTRPVAAPPKVSSLPRAPLDTTSLALLLITLQQPAPGPGGQPMPPPAPGPGGNQPAEVPEAGLSFWKALKLAREQKFPDALKALAEARKHHEARRFTQLRKAQNPVSDPTEEIFLRAAEQLTAYWQLQEKLQTEKYLNLADRKDPAVALTALIDALKKARTETEDVRKTLTKVTDEKNKAEEKATGLEKDLKKSQTETASALATVKVRDKTIEDQTKALADEAKKLAQTTLLAQNLDKDKKELEATITLTGKTLDLKDLDPKAGRDRLMRKLKDTVDMAREKDPAGRLAENLEKVRTLTATLAQRWAPEEMLGFWARALAETGDRQLSAPAQKDVKRVLTDTRANLGARSQAKAVEGLALRNQGEYAQARTTLREALDADTPGTGWKPLARKALEELTKPDAYYVPRIQELRARRQYEEALRLIEEGLKVFPEGNGRLLAERSLVRLNATLDQARGRPVEGTPGIGEARTDADAAVKGGAAADGHHAAGRIAEALGQWDEAAASYAKAAEASPAGSPEAARNTLARLRVLQAKLGNRGMPGARLPGRTHGLRGAEAILMALIGLQPPLAEEEAQAEAIRQADQILARKDIDRFPLLKGQALAVKGLWTQALNAYVVGLRPHLSRELADGLEYIVNNNPVQRRPDRMRIALPAQAERFYASGLGRFFARDYPGAEKAFTRAIENFDLDARYHYFRGLARLQQGKIAGEDLDQAARLELNGRPNRDAVETALERVQGRPRVLINEARDRVREAP